MTDNLLVEWTDLDSTEFWLLLNERIPGPGQYDAKSRRKLYLYLPCAGTSCRLVLTYGDRRIVRVERGEAFDVAEWDRIRNEIETSILVGPPKVGRAYSFSSFRVNGSWRGNRSGVQILQPPPDAPQSPSEKAEHPFILEFPIRNCELWRITNHRRLRDHRKLTLLLNVLLAGRTSLQSRRSEHFWACVRGDDESTEIKWVKQCYFANLGEAVIDQLSPVVGERLEEIEPEAYHATVGHAGNGLRLPTDLDDSICLYFHLSPSNRPKLDRATFWIDMASRLWTVSLSSSFASLVSAIESLNDRGTTHRVYCQDCKAFSQHEVPGVTEKFRAFFERYAPGAALRSRRSEMYSLRSGIFHGSELMRLDQDFALGGDAQESDELELHYELWALTRIAVRNWLKNPLAK